MNYKKKKGVWKIYTNQGTKILKKSPLSKERMSFILSAIQHLQGKGIYLPDIIPTKSGSLFLELKGAYYIMSESIAGPPPSYDSIKDLEKIMQTLGRFHKASRGFQSPMEAKEREHLGKWAESYQKHINDLSQFKALAAKDSSLFSKLFLKHVDSFVNQGNQALQVIQSPAYLQWVEKVNQQKNLCHQDFAAGNLMKTKKGVAVIDMDSLTFDLPARDIRKIFNKVMKKKGWNISKASRMLESYHSAHPLTAEEYKVIYADLLFPHLFYGISSKYYQNRAKEWSSAKHLEKLKMNLRSEKSKEQVLSKWDKLVQKVISGRGGSV